MKKKLPQDTSIKEIDGTKYVILPDNRVARLVRPTPINGKDHYNLFIKGKYTRIGADKIRNFDANETQSDSSSDSTDHSQPPVEE